ncbi:hypothetical protein [Escherichia coli]|uniref:hypothetical protein n=1 Tax=Escherichia coli TaxID=562 RepID=UPI000B7AF172|nr:hypothetical protein [Escherichia coli]EIA6527246.1 hypothetical protein [Escherichia coli]OXL04271.1 hypothetical protein CD806_02680 [Escherichia coli]HAJ8823693.1 hypothetical protein [Escherichia coli]
MTQRNFLLTYSVRPVTDHPTDEEKADKVRRKIARIDEWFKTSDVETTFLGKVEITYTSESYKKEQAEDEVRRLFIPILEECDARSRDVKIHCAMMVENIEQPFEFVVHK